MHILIVALLLIFFGVDATLPAAAAQHGTHPTTTGETNNPPGTHTLNLKDADIQALIATVSEITGKNFILGPNVQGKVTVVSAKPMKPDEIYDVFLSVLRVQGFAAIPSGSMIKIVPEAMAQQDGSAALDGSSAHAPDELVTQVVTVKHLSAAELVPILRPLMPQGGQLIAHGSSNSLVISDRAGNVQRLIGIIQRIDTVSDTDVEVIPLGHASAAELARTITQLADNKTNEASGEQAKIFADERTNSIMLTGGKNARLRLRALITHLDTPLNNGGDTQVVYLHYANAKDLVSILQGVASTVGGDGAPKPIAIAGAAAGAVASSGGPNNVTIQAHEQTNALVISAPPAVFRSLQAVIRQLDIRRAQVLIEAVIAEVSDQASTQIGVQWQFAPHATKGGNLGSGVIGGTNFAGGTSGNSILTVTQNGLAGLSGVGEGLNLGYVGGSVKLPGSDKPIIQIGALIQALKGDAKSNVLSTPSILTLDNQEAVIKVAQEVPFITGNYTTNTGGGSATAGSQIGNPFQTIQRKDVGLTLTVTPHINQGDSVRLDIHQEVSNIAAAVKGAVDIVTNKREIQTSVLVLDDAMLVLGGLLDNQAQDSVQGVPGLSNIPVIGNLFRTRGNSRTKSSLMVFLHPKILRDAATEAAISSEKYNYIRTEQLQMQNNPAALTPRNQQPLIPDSYDLLMQPPAPQNVQPVQQAKGSQE